MIDRSHNAWLAASGSGESDQAGHGRGGIFGAAVRGRLRVGAGRESLAHRRDAAVSIL